MMALALAWDVRQPFEARWLDDAQVSMGLDQMIEAIIRDPYRIEPWPLLVQAVAAMRRRRR
jgi:hypothetical protein